MAILGIDHVSLLAKDAQEVIKFYESNLGFAQDSRISSPEMEIFYLRKGDDVIEIIQPSDVSSVRQGGLKHLALLSDDIEADYQRLKEQGAELLHSQVQHNGPMSFFFMHSPGGEWVEIVQH